MNQTAHISLQIFKFSNSVETKVTEMRPNFSARPACIISVFSLRLVAVCLRFRFRVARLAPRWCISAPPVRGYLRSVPRPCNPFFREICDFCVQGHFSYKNRLLVADYCPKMGVWGSFIALTIGQFRRAWPELRRYPQGQSGIPAGLRPESPPIQPSHPKILCPPPPIQESNSLRSPESAAQMGVLL